MQPRNLDRESAQTASAPANQTPEGRRGRRRKAKERREAEAGTEPEAGPSGVNTPTETSEKKETAEQKGENAFEEADFIAFAFSDPEEDADERPPAREWDKGKGRASEHDYAGRKRKSGEYERDDGYANKKQRVAAASRKAPWTVDVDWDSCANVAEMYVPYKILSVLCHTNAEWLRLNRDVEAFVHYISPTPEEDEVRSLIVAQISRAVKAKFPDAQVLPFGSYETKLYLPTGYVSPLVRLQGAISQAPVTLT